MLKQLVVGAVCLFVSIGTAAAERRVALVFGNGAYKSAPKLPNASLDAEAIAGMLKRNNFEVVLGLDLDRDQMFSMIDKFGELARGADAAIFYFAGHGLQIDGKNLIVPVEAQIKTELDAKRKTVEVDTVLNHTMQDAKVKIVLLDACRENPFASDIASDQQKKTRAITVKGGLAEMKPGEGTIIQFATAAGALALDGKDGEHSPFTKALLTHLPKPDVEIQHALTMARRQISDDTQKQQQPWYSTNITGFFYMQKQQGDATLAPTTVAAAAPAVGAAAMDGQKEILFWESIKASTSSDDFKAYLEQYPQGTYSQLARNRIAALAKGPVASSPHLAAAAGAQAAGTLPSAEARAMEGSSASEDALGLNRDAWRIVQKRLSALGYGTRGIDGRVGEGTRTGIRAWQTARGFPTAGYLNKPQYEALLAEPVSAAAMAKFDNNDSDSDDKPAPTPRAARSASGSSNSGNSSGSSGQSKNQDQVSAPKVIESIAKGAASAIIQKKLGFPW